jgi:hypothetical protein
MYFPHRAEIEAAKTLLFGFSSLTDSNAPKLFDTSVTSKAAPLSVRDNQKSKLNSKRPFSESEEDENSEEDLGFGDSDYFKDKKYGRCCYNIEQFLYDYEKHGTVTARHRGNQLNQPIEIVSRPIRMLGHGTARPYRTFSTVIRNLL